MDLNNRVCLVTGACSGLGAAVTEMVIANGGRVVMLDINQDAGLQKFTQYGDAAIFQKTNVADEHDAEAAIKEAITKFGRIDGLINCAGIAPGEKVVGREGPHRFETFNRAINVNLIGTFNMMRVAAAAMSTQNADDDGARGVIINTASIAAFDGQIGQIAYAASKGGVVAMTLPAARELARFGIRVVTIAPGIFETPMMAAMPQDIQDALGASVPFPSRLGRPSEYASLVKHIFENTMINGETIRLDGALRMAAK